MKANKDSAKNMRGRNTLRTVVFVAMIGLLALSVLFAFRLLHGGYEIFIDIVLIASLFYVIVSQVISERKIRAALEQARHFEQNYKAIFEWSNDIIYEWDMKNDELLFSPKWYEVFGDVPSGAALRDPVHYASFLHTAERKEFADHINQLVAGQQTNDIVVRLKSKTGRYVWYQTRSSLLLDDDGRPDRAVGYLIDVTKEQQEKQLLKSKAQKDPLTRLYNKSASKELIDSHLSQAHGRLCAFLILDVDNFKMINDTQGHPYGDRVLQQVAKGLRQIFRSTDIVARIGGDEFLVFLKNIPSKEFATEKASMVCELFHEIGEKEGAEILVSCSIGIAYCPEHGISFMQLYENGDAALYRAKQSGRDRYAVAGRK